MSRLFSRHLLIALAALLLPALLTGCAAETKQPDYFEVLEVSGTPYERGYQQGVHFADKIRSFYTMLLTNSIFPYLNRDRDDVSSVLMPYQDEDVYGDGKFPHQMMLESARIFAEFIPQEYLDEMRGLADGSGMPYEEILLLNTFFDTLMGFRGITFYIRLVQGPRLEWFEFVGDLDQDGIDNDGDGEIDEPAEGRQKPYEPSPFAHMSEVPLDAKLRFILDDDKPGVSPDSIRIQLDDKLYLAGDPSIETSPYARDGKTIEVVFTPPEGLPPASVVSLILQATDLTEIERIKPYHPRPMRDERITFTTAGYGARPAEVPNRGLDDGRTQPPSYGFAVRGSATRDGNLYVAHHFAMIDSNTMHKHVTLIIHHPNDGAPFAVLGYTGVIWGLSGINSRGFTYFFDTSDTLNNPFTQSFNEGLIFAKLTPHGVPAGFMGREMLKYYGQVAEGLDYLRATPASFGWNFLLADANGDMAAAEIDSDITARPEGGFYTYSADPDNPENRDAAGRLYGSVGPDDLRIASHYQKDLNEIGYELVTFNIQPQRYWSSFYFRSLRAFYNAGDALAAEYGQLDRQRIMNILGRKALADQRDSMVAAVFEPQTLKMFVAAGEVPATDAGFRAFDLKKRFQGGTAR